jgi:hypothetical protein
VIPAWIRAAACRGVSTATSERFHTDSVPVQREMIRTFCQRCPVTDDCLQAAIDEEPSIAYGIRGGLTGHERTTLRRNRQREPAAA